METVGRGILLISPGSRGDVQPFVALALGLEAAGHRVTVAAPENLRALVERAGVRLLPLDVDFAALSDRPELTSGNAIARATTNADIAQRAGELGERLRAEDGVGRAVRAIEERLSRGVRDGDARPS